MENKTLTKVMWLEEDLFEAENFIEDALNYDLEVVRFTCWEDAINSITENPKKWEAIVLDPKCKLYGGDYPNPKRFLPQVFCDITALSIKNDIIYPWYIFTNLPPIEFQELVIKDRERFDRDWERPYYIIDQDAKRLLTNIKNQTSNRERTKIREGVHKDMFEKLAQLSGFSQGFTKEDIASMEDLMISIYENKDSNRCNFVNLRKIIEGLFKSMIYFNIVPNNIRNENGEINLTSYCRILSGKDHYGKSYILKEKFLDEVAVSNLWMILEICNGSSHAKSTNDNTVRKDVNKYLAITGTKNLLHACTLMLADIILMYCHNIIKHSAEIQSGTSFWS